MTYLIPPQFEMKQIYWSKYLQSLEKIQWKLYEFVSHTMQYQTIIFSEQLSRLALLKTLSVCRKKNFSINLLHAYLQYVCNISTKCWLKTSWVHKVCPVNHYLLGAVVETWLSQFVRNIISAPNFFMYIFNELKRSSEISKRSWFHKVCTTIHYLLGAVVRKWLG